MYHKNYKEKYFYGIKEQTQIRGYITKGKAHRTTDHEGPEGGKVIALIFP